jgi:hypothetical protein
VSILQSRMRLLGVWAMTLLMLVVPSVRVFAQATTGAVEGTLVDSSRSVLPGVTVTVTNLDTGIERRSVSDAAGRYRAENLLAGNYEVKAELDGFRVVARRGIVLTIGRRAVVDITMEVGKVAEEVVVMGEASLVNTKEGTLSSVIEGGTIRELPVNGRDFLRLTLLESGAVPVTYRKEVAKGAGLQVALNGARPTATGYFLDGTNIKGSSTFQTPGSAAGVMLGVDTIREFEVLSNGFGAEYGNASGGVINAVTRSGSNAYHGSAFGFYRNDSLDSSNYFDTTDVPFSRKQWGATIGGPIVKNKTFFFAGFEHLNESLGLTTLMVVPNAAARAGHLPSGDVAVNPVVVPYLDLWPLPNGRDFGDGTGEFAFGHTYPTSENFAVLRLDHHFSDTDQFYVRYSFDNADSISRKGSFPNNNFGLNNHSRNNYLVGEYTKILGSSTANMFRASWNRSDRGGLDAVLGEVDPALKFVPGGEFGLIRIGGLTDPGVYGNYPLSSVYDVMEFQDHVTVTRGRHNMKFGAQLSTFREQMCCSARPGGEYGFRSFSDFLQGKSNRLRIPGIGSDPNRDWNSKMFGFFAQDSFTISPKLTLSLGLRYEFITVPTEADGKVANLRSIFDKANTVGDPLFQNPSKGNIAPRLGFAWDPAGNGKTSIRGAFGIYYDELNIPYLQAGNLNRNSPFYFDTTIRNPFFPDAIRSLTDIPADGVLESPTAVQFEAKQPTLYHFNLSVQRQILPETVVTVAYAGSRGKNLGRLLEYNNVDPVTLPDGRLFFPEDAVRRNPTFDTADYKIQDGHSFYNSLQFKIARRMSHGLLMNASYTWAKSVDDSSNGVSASDYTYPSEIPNWYGATSWRGLSEFDIRHSLSIYAAYEVPWAENATGLKKALLGGWQLGGIIAIRSGSPFPIKLAIDQARTQGKSDTQLPNLVPGASNNPIRPDNPDQYFDPSAFSLPEAGFFGDLGRNTTIGPGLKTVDVSLFKNHWFHNKDSNLQLRLEVFNLFNRNNFSNPVDNVYVYDEDGPINSAGRIGSTSTSARQIQLGVKLTF